MAKELSAKEKKDMKVELKARKIVLKKLDSSLSSLDKSIDRIRQKREDRKASLSDYRNEHELQDAYGWDFIASGVKPMA